MGFLGKLKKLFTVQRKDELLEKKVEVVNSSPVRERLSQSLNRRDLAYARDIGKWEILADTIQRIKEDTGVLKERVPDVVLTEKRFGVEMGGLHIGLNELFRRIQLLMNSSTDRPPAETVEKVVEVAEELALSLREQEILEFLEFRVRSTAWEVGYVLGISRSRCNQILKIMERRGILITEKLGRKTVFKLSQG